MCSLCGSPHPFSQHCLCPSMALSWNELRADHKVVLLFDSLNEEDLQTPIACRFCDAIFYDNKSLLNHFHSHFHQDGAYNGRLLFGSSVPPRNSSSFISLQPNWSSNFNSGPSGPLYLRSPVRLTSADMYNSEPTTQSTFRLPTAPGTSTSQSIRPITIVFSAKDQQKIKLFNLG